MLLAARSPKSADLQLATVAQDLAGSLKRHYETKSVSRRQGPYMELGPKQVFTCPARFPRAPRCKDEEAEEISLSFLLGPLERDVSQNSVGKLPE
jgi:hypothetical protein